MSAYHSRTRSENQLPVMTTYILLIIVPLIVALWAQAKVSGTYKRYSKVRSRSGITGREAALYVMRAAGIDDVEVIPIRGHLTDHYDPTRKRLALSGENFAGTSLAALGVSAHEAGHAIQHAQGYKALQLRMSLIPVTTIDDCTYSSTTSSTANQATFLRLLLRWRFSGCW